MEEINTHHAVGVAQADAVEAAIGAFRRQQLRRPSNLLQCMDQDGNIDAFRYIEYSRQRRMEFLKRADFICKMKSTLRFQQHQQLNRSASLPGMTATPAMSSEPSMANEVFTGTHSASVSSETTSNTVFLDIPKSLGTGADMPTTPAVTRLMARSASLPFVTSFVPSTTTSNTSVQIAKSAATFAGGSNARSRNADFEGNDLVSRAPQRRRLRKEEFEAAEALLFGMGRGSAASSIPGGTGNDKRNSDSSSEDGDGGDAAIVVAAEEEVESHTGDDRDRKSENYSCSKKRKHSDLPPTLARSEEMETVLSVVSAEDESSSGNNTNAQED